MTDLIQNPKKRRGFPFGQIPLTVGCLCLLFLFLFRSEETAEQVMEGLSLCLRRVIPSLFPFMVISSLILSSDFCALLARLLSRPFRRIFGVSGQGGCAVILGLLCGFPVAAQCAVSLYENEQIGREEFCRLMTFANNPSAAFLVGGVGYALFEDPFFGILLYLLTLISAALIGVFQQLVLGTPTDSLSRSPVPAPSRSGKATCFTGAVISSSGAMVSICGFVVFFTVLMGTLSDLLPTRLPEGIRALLLGCLEMTGGTELAASCASPLCYVLCAFFAGWSGFSVHFQLMSMGSRAPFFFRGYLLAKLCHGILNGLLMGVVFWIRLYVP